MCSSDKPFFQYNKIMLLFIQKESNEIGFVSPYIFSLIGITFHIEWKIDFKFYVRNFAFRFLVVGKIHSILESIQRLISLTGFGF